VFVGTAAQGHLWMIKNQDVCETATYTFLTECYKTIVTDQFIYSLTHNNTVLIHLMRHLDSHHSGAIYTLLKGEGDRLKGSTSSSSSSSSRSTSSSKVASKSQRRDSSDSKSTRALLSKTLVQQVADPLLVGAMDFMGLNHICANTDGKAMVLCKSTEDQIAALRDASLAGGKRRPRTSSNAAASQTSPSSPSRRVAAHGWNLISTNFHSVKSMLDQFRNWIGSDDTLTKDDWSILLECWTLSSSVISSLRRPLHPLQSLQWASKDDLIPAIAVKRSIYGKLAHLEFAADRFMRAAMLWSLSDVPVSQAIGRLMEKLKKGKKESRVKLMQDACVELLRHVLLGSSQRMDLVERDRPEFVDVVYAILAEQCAPLVGQVVLESPMDNFELDSAIVLLEETMAKLEFNIQKTSDVVNSFLTAAVVLDVEGEIQEKASPLDDFYQTQTLEERQLWMTTLALVVLMLKRGDGEALLARRNASFKGSLQLTTPDIYLLKLPEAFLVPYLTTHSHLMFETGSPTGRQDDLQTKVEAALESPSSSVSSESSLLDDGSSPSPAVTTATSTATTAADAATSPVPPLLATSATATTSTSDSTSDSTSNPSVGSCEKRPSKLALLLAQTMPWMCLEILVVAGPSIFPSPFAQELLSCSSVRFFPWLKFSMATHSGLTHLFSGSPAQVESAPSSPPRSSSPMESPASDDPPSLFTSNSMNPILLTAYLEAQVLPQLNPSPKVPLSQTHPSPPVPSTPPSSARIGPVSSPMSLRKQATTASSASSSSTDSPPSAVTTSLPFEQYLQDLILLSSRYIAHISMPSDEISQLLGYTTSDLVIKTNPHNTHPPVSLEGIWKEFHREYLTDSRYKFITNVPPLIPPVKGPAYQQQIPEHFYLFKLQGMLCALTEKASTTCPELSSRLPEIAAHILKELSAAQVQDKLQDSIRLLCMPIQGNFESSIVRLVEHHPTSLIQFLKKYLPMSDMAKWRTTLSVLLSHVSNPNYPDATWCLEETLKHMARNLPSEDFLNLLPANGNVAFFIPYIELNLGRNASMNLLAQLQALK